MIVIIPVPQDPKHQPPGIEPSWWLVVGAIIASGIIIYLSVKTVLNTMEYMR